MPEWFLSCERQFLTNFNIFVSGFNYDDIPSTFEDEDDIDADNDEEIFDEDIPDHTSTHHDDGRAPRITEHPVDTTVPRHDPATLNCKASGFPEPKVAWYKDGTPVRSSEHRMILPAGSLFFLRVAHGRRESDAGTYWCMATNSYGRTRSRNATLQVAGKYKNFYHNGSISGLRVYLLVVIILFGWFYDYFSHSGSQFQYGLYSDRKIERWNLFM